MIRIAYVDTDVTGGSMEVPGAEGILRAERHDPHGVVVKINDVQLSVVKENLADMGRFFLAAAVQLGQDIGSEVLGGH